MLRFDLICLWLLFLLKLHIFIIILIRKLLEDSRRWHQFLKQCGEAMNWLNSKLQIAYDESYQDATNLQSKLQKHQAFDAEVKANEDRIERILQEGNQLIASDHFAKQQVKTQLKGNCVRSCHCFHMQALWSKLWCLFNPQSGHHLPLPKNTLTFLPEFRLFQRIRYCNLLI